MATNIREKAVANKAAKDKRPQATAYDVRMTPIKMGKVLNLVRGKAYDDALIILSNINNSAAEVVKKVVMSAGANAENNLNLSKDNLMVAECYANSGPTLKRVWPRAKGSRDILFKRTSHVTVKLDNKKEVK